MTSYLWDNETDTWEPREVVLRKRALADAARSRRSDEVPLPHIISDCTEMRSMLDGKTYTSKRAYEASIKAGGCEIVGNSDLTKYTAPKYDEKAHVADIVQDVQRSIAEAKKQMNRDGTIESPWRVDDTRDDAAAAYKEVMERSFGNDEQDTPAPENEPAAAAEPASQPADNGAERARDPVTKRFVRGTPPSKNELLHPDPNGTQPATKTTDKKPEAVKEPEAAPNAEAAPEAVKAAPPPSFSIKTKADWDRLPEHVRADIAKRESEMQTGLAALRDYKDLKPYADMAKSHNTTIKSALDNYVAMENLLKRDLAGGLAQITQNFGMDQKQAAAVFASLAQKFGAPVSGQPSGQSQQEADPLAELMKPMLEPIVSQLNELRTYHTTRTEADRNAHLQSLGEAVEVFASDPANKFYPDLEEPMTKLLETGIVPITGNHAADLKAAYDMAARMNPAVHEALIEQRLTGQDEAKRKAEQDKVAKAKAASRSISGSRIPGTVIQQSEDEDDGDDIEATVRSAYRLHSQR